MWWITIILAGFSITRLWLNVLSLITIAYAANESTDEYANEQYESKYELVQSIVAINDESIIIISLDVLLRWCLIINELTIIITS